MRIGEYDCYWAEHGFSYSCIKIYEKKKVFFGLFSKWSEVFTGCVEYGAYHYKDRTTSEYMSIFNDAILEYKEKLYNNRVDDENYYGNKEHLTRVDMYNKIVKKDRSLIINDPTNEYMDKTISDYLNR